MIAHQTVEPIEVFAHVRRASCDIDPRRRSKPEHCLRPVQYGQQALAFPHRTRDALRFDAHRATQLPEHPRAPHLFGFCPVDQTTSTGSIGPPLDCCLLCARRRYLSSLPTARPRCWQNASRLRTAPASQIHQVHHQTKPYNRVRCSDGYGGVAGESGYPLPLCRLGERP